MCACAGSPTTTHQTSRCLHHPAARQCLGCVLHLPWDQPPAARHSTFAQCTVISAGTAHLCNVMSALRPLLQSNHNHQKCPEQQHHCRCQFGAVTSQGSCAQRYHGMSPQPSYSEFVLVFESLIATCVVPVVVCVQHIVQLPAPAHNINDTLEMHLQEQRRLSSNTQQLLLASSRHGAAPLAIRGPCNHCQIPVGQQHWKQSMHLHAVPWIVALLVSSGVCCLGRGGG